MRQLRTQNATAVAANFLTHRVQKDCLIPLPAKENQYATT
jgi:hypothetical protein